MTEDNNDEIKEEIKPGISVETGNIEAEPESKDIKMLEEKEHYELEYFSKEECEKELTDLKAKVEQLQKESNDSKNKYMHLQAEFENAQKRWNKNRQNLRIEYTASVLKNFLPLYDSFKKAIDSANETDKNILKSFYTQFMNIYKSYGVEPIPVKVGDSFDYAVHEALSSIENSDVSENSILEIIQDGFKYRKEVIRYAKVIISKKPKPPEPPPEEKEVEEEALEELVNEEDIPKQDETETKKQKKKKHKKHKKEEN